MKITDVIPRDDGILYIKTDDGGAGLFDVKPFLISEVFAPLKDNQEFARIHNGGYYIEWNCGADLSLDTIESQWIPDIGISAQHP